MDKYMIEGGGTLYGKLRAQSAKNAPTTRVTLLASPSIPSVRFTLFTIPVIRTSAKA